MKKSKECKKGTHKNKESFKKGSKKERRKERMKMWKGKHVNLKRNDVSMENNTIKP